MSRICVGICFPGHSFEDHEHEYEITLTCTDGYYTPLREFPPCRSGGYCDLIVQGSGSFNCTTGVDGTRCDIICNGRYVGRYFCYPGKPWHPNLPHCMRPKVMENCLCEFGGWCDSYGDCVCPVGRTGWYCEIITENCPCEFGGWCDSYGDCVCPVGRTGRYCEIKVVENYCSNPGPISNGKIVYNPPINNPSRGQSYADREFPEGGRLQYSCNSGYITEGTATLTCLPDGWSAPAPSCSKEVVENYCSNPGPISNGKIVYHPPVNNPSRGQSYADREFPEGGRLQYSCNSGYITEGTATLTCLPDGWSAPAPSCSKADLRNIKYCDNPGPILNGRIKYFSITARPRTMSTSLLSEDTSEYPEGTRLEYQCEDGYIMEGAFQLKCQSPGQWSKFPPKCVPDCGRSILGTKRRILHGNNTVVGESPWMVAIGLRQNNFTRLICGGAVLNTQTIVTAAHCLSGANQFVLYFGKYHRSDSLDDDQILVRTSDRLIVHPEYNNATMDNDIALMKFKPEIHFTDRILPICLPSAESTAYNLVSGRSGYVTGWGWTERRRSSEELLVAKLPYVSNSECTNSFRRNVENFNGSLTQNMFCAGYKEGNSQATCRGDSGAPFVFYDTLVERYTLEGLVSFGIEGQCGRPGIYSVFTKVYHFLPWIYRNL